MRARRLVAVAATAALGLASLAACGKSSPDVAAYVGDTKYSVERVDGIYDDAQTRYAAAVNAQAAQAGATPSPEQLRARVNRQDIVNLLVSIELGRRVATEKQLTVPDEVTPEQLAQPLQMPPDAEYAQLWGEWLDIYNTLAEKLPPAELSDASVMAVYDAIAATGAIQPGLTVAEVRQAFGTGDFVRQGSAVSAALQVEAEQAGVSINPAYRPVGVPSAVNAAQGPVFYSLPYIDESGPVTDISTPEAPATAAADA
ncbi:hypothetical protein V6U90_19945 [Micromonospora sp. CPCC 206060]|uniref:hypothetical protein n=1 Tax=Micromonospora sp. CPCC 206060 TaxID=3122406 RepID=UPI002FF13B78